MVNTNTSYDKRQPRGEDKDHPSMVRHGLPRNNPSTDLSLIHSATDGVDRYAAATTT